jgi:hypothetical protein
MNAYGFIKAFGASAAVCGVLCCLAPGCGPGLVPPSANLARTPNSGSAGAPSGAGTLGSDNPSQVTGPKGGGGGSGSLPNPSGRAGTTAPPPGNDADAGGEDAGVGP